MVVVRVSTRSKATPSSSSLINLVAATLNNGLGEYYEDATKAHKAKEGGIEDAELACKLFVRSALTIT